MKLFCLCRNFFALLLEMLTRLTNNFCLSGVSLRGLCLRVFASVVWYYGVSLFLPNGTDSILSANELSNWKCSSSGICGQWLMCVQQGAKDGPDWGSKGVKRRQQSWTHTYTAGIKCTHSRDQVYWALWWRRHSMLEAHVYFTQSIMKSVLTVHSWVMEGLWMLVSQRGIFS